MSNKNYVYKTKKGQAFHDFEVELDDVVFDAFTCLYNAVSKLYDEDIIVTDADQKKLEKIIGMIVDKNLKKFEIKVDSEAIKSFINEQTGEGS